MVTRNTLQRIAWYGQTFFPPMGVFCVDSAFFVRAQRSRRQEIQGHTCPRSPSGRKTIPYVRHQNFRLIAQTWGFPIPPCLGRFGHTPGSGRPAETNLTVRRPHQVHIYSIRFACMFLPSQQVPNGLPFSHPWRSPPVPVYCSPVGSSPRTGSLQVRRERPFSLSPGLPYSVV